MRQCYVHLIPELFAVFVAPEKRRCVDHLAALHETVCLPLVRGAKVQQAELGDPGRGKSGY